MARSFVHSLDIAHDGRLAQFRVAEAKHEFAPRRGPSEDRAESDRPPPINDKLRAAVDAGSIVSFVSGLGAEQMSDVSAAGCSPNCAKRTGRPRSAM